MEYLDWIVKTEVRATVLRISMAEVCRRAKVRQKVLWEWRTGKHLPSLRTLRLHSQAIDRVLAAEEERQAVLKADQQTERTAA